MMLTLKFEVFVNNVYKEIVMEMFENNGEEAGGLEWTDDALKRVERVPQGFMRNMTKKRIEKYAREISAGKVTLEVAEKGLEGAKSAMSSMMGGGGGMPHAMPGMDEDKPVSKPDAKIDDGVDYFYCDICGYTVKGYAPDECPICRADGEKFKLVKNKDELVTASSGRALDWAPDAAERLTQTPEGFMRDMTKWRIEAFTRKHGELKVTVEMIEKKYAQWGEGSKAITQELKWDDEATEKINKIPDVVRGMVIKEVENEAERSGTNIVTQEILTKVRNKWSSSMEFHSDLPEE